MTISRRAVLTCVTAVALTGRATAAAQGIAVRDNGLVGTLFLPGRPSASPAVICLTGAMGGLWEAPARALAAEGFAALALATHNFPGLPERLRLLPLDYIEQAVEWMRSRCAPKAGCVALRGWSRSGELALLLASLTPSVNAVLAYSPRLYVGRENGKPNNFDDPTAAAAWTWRGAPVVGEPLPRAMMANPAHQSFEDLFGIAIERIKGPIMLVSGEADTGLAGTTATYGCNKAMRRLAQYRFAYRHEHLSYADAGHDIAGPPPFTGPVEEGGTLAGNAAAVADSWPHSLAFLRDATEPNRSKMP
jgi:dienelactone hydrolase